ncbi:MAG: nucleoside hydrolase [Clostridia bacterium]|nr:nucleoside hydrolase [Clostridia bacterium]
MSTVVRKAISFMAAIALLALSPVSVAEEQSEGNLIGKVIFDTDMTFLYDDAIAMFMLTQAEQNRALDLLGITTVGGNVYEAEATEATLRQLELIGREDVPVYRGTDVPLAGFRDMEEEARLYGVPDWCGAYWDFATNSFSNPYARPTDYADLGYEPEFGYPTVKAQEQPAWVFMIEQVHKYPGEVTIMAVGAATNVAIAIQRDPSFVRDAAGIIYMGGNINVPGNSSATAEFNWFYDPDAIKLCLAADWKVQLVVPDDLGRLVDMDQSIYDRLRAVEGSKIAELILYREQSYLPDAPHYVWDVIVPAIYLHPEIMTDIQTRYLTVDDQPGLNYGRAVSWVQNRNNDPETGAGMPEGVRPVQILLDIDTGLFWDFYVDLLTAQ